VEPGSVTARSYQGQDEVYLSQINPLNLEKNYFQVLKGLLRGIEPDKLTLGDRLYIIIWECINSYTDTLRVQAICPNCIKEIEVSIDLKSLEVTQLPETFVQPYEVTLPVSGEKMYLRLFTVEDDIEVERYNQNNDDGYLYRYARSVVSDLDILQILEKFRNMKAKDLMRIRAFHEKFYHGPEMLSKVICPKCEREVEVDVPFRLDFFFPDGSTIDTAFGAGV
jgi:hypothetical protein